ncbi:MAG: hypothetical protein AABY22_17955, partial [Nanoarchaeota archaeon]
VKESIEKAYCIENICTTNQFEQEVIKIAKEILLTKQIVPTMTDYHLEQRLLYEAQKSFFERRK